MNYMPMTPFGWLLVHFDYYSPRPSGWPGERGPGTLESRTGLGGP